MEEARLQAQIPAVAAVVLVRLVATIQLLLRELEVTELHQQ